MDEQLLSKEELDALLNSVDEGSAYGNNGGMDTDVYSYDLTSQEKVVRGRLPELERINDRFLKGIKESVFQLMKKNVSVSSAGIQIQKYSEYCHGLHIPTNLNIIRLPPLKGFGLLAIEAKLLLRMVDFYFGGNGKDIKVIGQEFSRTELKFIDNLQAKLFGHLSTAWEDVVPCQPEFVKRETKPSLAVIAELSETVIVSAFHIEVDGAGGDLHLVLPYAMIEPIRDVLEGLSSNEKKEVDENWVNTLTNSVMSADVAINCTVTEKIISLRDIIDMEPGDVIPVEINDKLVMTANEIPVFNVSMGTLKGNLALQVIDKIDNKSN